MNNEQNLNGVMPTMQPINSNGMQNPQPGNQLGGQPVSQPGVSAAPTSPVQSVSPIPTPIVATPLETPEVNNNLMTPTPIPEVESKGGNVNSNTGSVGIVTQPSVVVPQQSISSEINSMTTPVSPVEPIQPNLNHASLDSSSNQNVIPPLEMGQLSGQDINKVEIPSQSQSLTDSQMVSSNNNQNEEGIVSVGTYLVYLIIMMIPIVNIIYLIIKAFDKKNKNIRNLARAQLILYFVSILLFVVWAIIYFITFKNMLIGA